MSNSKYIYETKFGYKFRLRIPKGLRVYFDDKSEIIKTITIENYKKALAVARMYRVEFDRLIVSLSLNHSDKAITKQLVKNYYVNVLNNSRGYKKPDEAVREINYVYAIDSFIKHLNTSETMSDKFKDEMINFFDEILRQITKGLVLKLVDIDDLIYVKSRLKNMPIRTHQDKDTITPPNKYINILSLF